MKFHAKLRGSFIFSTFDMRSGYHHVASPESQSKSAFVIGGPHGGKFEFKVCPFGLTQAPAYFQRLVDEVLRGLPFALDTWMIYLYLAPMSKHIWNILKYYFTN